VLAPNGSLYCFASPQMAAMVECVVAERFDVLNSLVWVKPNGCEYLSIAFGRV
jgi:adenine-specific DNA-methyltransferase